MYNQNNITNYPTPSRELVNKYSSKKTSFYCYYPMNGLWNETNTQSSYISSIEETFKDDKKKPIAFYIHFPFCKTQCLFCHCFTVISNRQDDHNKIIDYLIKEIEILKKIFNEKGFSPNIKEIHFGGGSPSNLTNENFSRLFDAIKSLSLTENFDTCALEVDPRYEVDVDKMHFYADQGITRISFGVQDFDEKIGKILNRENSPEMIKRLIPDEVRKRFEGVNFDLIFGMPEQTMETWLATIAAAGLTGTLLAFGGLWGVPYLMAAREIDKPSAASFISIIFIGWAVGAPFFGWLSDRIGKRRVLLLCGTAGAALTISTIIVFPKLSTILIIPVLTLKGFFSASMILGFALAKENNPAESSGVALGLINTFVVGSGAILQPVVGVLLDYTWSGQTSGGVRIFDVEAFQVSMAILPLICLLSFVSAFYIREPHSIQNTS